MIDLIGEKSCYNKEKSTLIITRDEEGRYNDVGKEPAILKNNFQKHTTNSELKIHFKHGVLHNEGQPAISLSNDQETFDIYIENGQLVDVNEKCISLNHMFAYKSTYSISKTSYNHQYIAFNGMGKKATGYIDEHSLISSLNALVCAISESNVFDLEIAKLFRNFHDNFFKYNTNSFKPNLVIFNEKQKISSLFWLNENGEKHRIGKPAAISFFNDCKSIAYYEDGKEQETIYKPFSFYLNNSDHSYEGTFFFKNKEIQRFYKEYDFNPFSMNEDDENIIALNFKI